MQVCINYIYVYIYIYTHIHISGFILCPFCRHQYMCNVSIIHLVTLGSYTSSLFSPKSFSLDYFKSVNKAPLASLSVCSSPLGLLLMKLPSVPDWDTASCAMLELNPCTNLSFHPSQPWEYLCSCSHQTLHLLDILLPFFLSHQVAQRISPPRRGASLLGRRDDLRRSQVKGNSQLSCLLPLCTFQYWGITNQKLQIKSYIKQMLSGIITSTFCAFCFENHKHSKFWNHTDCQLSKQLRNSSSHTPLSGFSWTADRSVSETCMCP